MSSDTPPISATTVEKTKHCISCKEMVVVSSFDKDRNQCNPCRSKQAAERHEKKKKATILVKAADGTMVETVVTKTCNQCNETKLMNSFEPNRNMCTSCRSRQKEKSAKERATAFVKTVTEEQRLPRLHGGEWPKECRHCKLQFTKENAEVFHYRDKEAKYMDLCIECRREHTVDHSKEYRERKRAEDLDGYRDEQAAKHRAYMALNPEKRAAAYQKQVSDAKQKLAIIRRSAKSASQRQISFEEGDADAMLAKLLLPCFYCGITAAENKGRLSGLDRIDSFQWYTDANTAPACSMCNYMKCQYTLPGFLSQCRRIAAHHPIDDSKLFDADDASESVSEEVADGPGGGGIVRSDAEETLFLVQRKRHVENVEQGEPAEVRGKKARPNSQQVGVQVTFYNCDTNAVAFIAPNLKVAGNMYGIKDHSVKVRLTKPELVWTQPNWCARHYVVGDIVDKEAKKVFIKSVQKRDYSAPENNSGTASVAKRLTLVDNVLSRRIYCSTVAEMAGILKTQPDTLRKWLNRMGYTERSIAVVYDTRYTVESEFMAPIIAADKVANDEEEEYAGHKGGRKDASEQ